MDRLGMTDDGEAPEDEVIDVEVRGPELVGVLDI